MLIVEITEQEKKDLAVIYGFLVDVWNAQQHKAERSAVLNQGRKNNISNIQN